jgi:hypothetical protein
VNNPVRAKQIQTGLWTIVAVLIVVIGVALLSAVDDGAGNPWIENNIVVQTLLTISAVAAIALPSLVSARKDVAETNRTTAIVRDQVQNSHTVNLRDDQDQKHDVVVDLISQVIKIVDVKIEGVHSDIRGLRKDIGRNTDQIDRNASATSRLGDQFHEYREEVDERFNLVENSLEDIKTTTGSIAIIQEGRD